MKGIGGPLLCIGDLLSDVGEDSPAPETPSISKASSSSNLTSTSEAVDLSKHFQVPFWSKSKSISVQLPSDPNSV